MPDERTKPGGSRPVEWLLLVAAYVATGWAGLGVASVGRSVTLFWPPTGVAIAALARRGPRLVPAVFVAAIAVNLLTSGGRLAPSLAIGVGNALEAWVASIALRRAFRDPGELVGARDAALYVLVAALSCVPAALVGPTALVAFGLDAGAGFARSATVWWMGDLTGALALAPTLLAFSSPATRIPEAVRGPRAWVEAIALGLATLVAFGIRYEEHGAAFAVVLVPLMFVAVCALRFGARGATTASSLVITVATLATELGRGPYTTDDPEDARIGLWVGLIVVALGALLLSALVRERMRAEAALATSELRFRTAFEHAPMGIALVTRAGILAAANPSVATMLRLGVAELAGRAVDDFIGRDGRERVRAALVEARANGLAFASLELPLRRADGTVATSEVRVSHLRERASEVAFIVQLEDVTERERARKERADLERQLVVAQRMESVGNLAGGVAHDFNNMLQAILGNLDLANLGLANGARVETYLERAARAGERAAALTRQLLAFSRGEPAALVSTDWGAVVRASAELLDRLLPESVRLELDLPDAPMPVLADPAQLDQVLVNLAVNARDAMPDGGVLRVSMRAVPGEPGSGRIELVVKDTGVGIDASVRDRIFEPFVTTKPLGKGTGLGLSVVYGVVRQHGGDIRVESERGKGTTFTISLPRHVLVEEARPASRTSESEPIAVPARGTVLVVEDEPMVREVVRDALASAGYTVATANDGRQALAWLDAHRGEADLVLLDVVMPVMGGRATYACIREEHPDVRVLFTTGYADDDVDTAFLAREGLDVLSKPYERAALLEAVRRAMRAPREVTTRRRPA